MKNSLIWTSPSITCLGDRLVDTMILSTYAKLINADLYFPWKDCPFTIGSENNPTYSYKPGENKTWDKVRFEDYKFENYSKYFNLPKNIKINESTDNITHYFNDILGGCVSPNLFYKRYASDLCTIEEFNKLFRETMSEFKPTEILLDLVKNNQKPDVSVHLRRTDKINVLGDYSSFMTYEGLDRLNEMTKDAINKLDNGNRSFYFSSDDVNERDKYHNSYPNHIKHNTNCTDVEKTYIDLYMLSISDYIILSQVHSNFSIFASYINDSKLIYLYDNCMIVSQEFNENKNFIHYKNL